MIRRWKDKRSLYTVITMIPAAVFLVFVAVTMIKTYTGTVKERVKETGVSFESFVSLTDEFETILQENCYEKNRYINLNGLVAKVLDFHTLNERQKLANGYLCNFEEKRDARLLCMTHSFLPDIVVIPGRILIR